MLMRALSPAFRKTSFWILFAVALPAYLVVVGGSGSAALGYELPVGYISKLFFWRFLPSASFSCGAPFSFGRNHGSFDSQFRSLP
jgi:predicted permease